MVAPRQADVDDGRIADCLSLPRGIEDSDIELPERWIEHGLSLGASSWLGQPIERLTLR